MKTHRLSRLSAILLITALSLMLLSPCAGAAPQSDSEQIDVLVGFHSPVVLAQVQRLGGQITREFNIVDAVAARMSPAAARRLEGLPSVAYVEPDAEVYALQLSWGQSVPWGIDRVFGAEEYPFDTWDETRGAGIAVAVLDTGIDENHEDLPSLLGGTNTIDGTHWGSDVFGHGTPVAGVIAALDNGIGVVGVTPQVGLYSVKVLDDEGRGTTTSVIAGIEWAMQQGIPIINLSLGGGGTQTFKDACQNAYDAGHLLVAAAGNDPDVDVRYPAAYSSVIAVSASDSSDQLASFSATGPEVELIAPGVSVTSTYPSDLYAMVSGTSFSAPHVAGAAALAWTANSELTNVQIREILQDTAEDLGLEDIEQGHGLVRADRAVDEALVTDPPEELDDPFDLSIFVLDKAGDPFVSEAEMTVTFFNTTADPQVQETVDLGGVDFSGTEGTKTWTVGTGEEADITITEMETTDINEIEVQLNGVTDRVTGLNP